MPRHLSIIFAFLFWLSHSIVFGTGDSPRAPDDEVLFANGDTLQGFVVKKEGNRIYFQSTALGLLVLPRDNVVLLSEKRAAEVAAKEARMLEVAVEAETEVAAATQERRATTVSRPKWNRRLEFGMTGQRGRRDRIDFNARFQAELRARHAQHRFQSAYLYGYTRDITLVDRIEGNYRYRHDISPILFTQSHSSYRRDRIQKINHNVEQKLGLGYRLLARENLKVNVGAGASGRFRDDQRNNDRYEWLMDSFQDSEYTFNSRFKLSQEFTFLAPPEDWEEFTLTFKSALTGRITDTINLSLRYEFEYDGSLQPNNREHQRFITSLGYVF